MDNTIKQAMKSEFKNEIEKGYITPEGIQEYPGDWIEGYLPVYYNEIVKQWQGMRSEYNDRGHTELGHLEQEVTIYNLMSLDLYLYYTDIFNEAIAELEEELELAE